MARKKFDLGENGLPKRSGLYWNHGLIYLALRRHGRIVFKNSTKTRDFEAAMTFREAKLEEILKAEDDTVADQKKGVTVNELFDDYVARTKLKEEEAGAYQNTGREYERNSYKLSTRIDKNLRPFFGKIRPQDQNPATLTTQLLLDYKKKRRREKATVPTCNTELRLLRAALKRGTRTAPRKVNPLHIPDFSDVINIEAEENAAREGTITPEQYAKIMEHASEHLKPVFAAIYYSGIRSKEIKFVRREHEASKTGDRRVQVDFNSNVINLRKGETKNGHARVCGMNDHVKKILQAWEANTAQQHPHCEWFFHLDGQQLGNWKTAWKAALKRAGLKSGYKESGLVFHDTRRTNITSLSTLGVEEKHIMSNSGHKTVSMSRRYDQSAISAGVVTEAQNKALGIATAVNAEDVPFTPPIAPAVSKSDWKAELTELKAMLDDGILTAEEFAAEKARIMGSRFRLKPSYGVRS